MRRPAILLTVALLALPVAVSPASAQYRGARDTSNAFQIRFGYFLPTGGGEFWNGTESAFTLNHSDFDDFDLGFGYVTGINNNMELGFNLDFYYSSAGSQYRDWVDQNGLPIFHDTTLRLAPATVDFRFLPTGRFGYRGSRGQYRVHKPVPYFGAGVGLQYWEYEETGDFLDFSAPPPTPPTVFPSHFHDSGVSPEAHVLAGIELPVGPMWGFLVEGRYAWSTAGLGGDFSGLGDLKLDGFSGYLGFSFHF